MCKINTLRSQKETANQAFILPSQKTMGYILTGCDTEYISLYSFLADF